MEFTVHDREYDLIGHLKKWKHARPDAYIMERFITAAVTKEEEITSLRVQVEELSKYPEEAVRAVCEALLEKFGEMPIEEGEWQAAKRAVETAFKEKQGAGA